MTPNDLVKEAQINGYANSGIYMIYCMPVEKAYIGQSKNIHRRWSDHRSSLKYKTHGNSYLQNLYDKYGKQSFSYYLLEACIDDLTTKEAQYLDKLDKRYRLNLKGIIDKVPVSDETRAKISASKQGFRHSDVTKKKISEAKIGKKRNEFSNEAKKKMSIAHTGEKFSEERKLKMSKSIKKWWASRKNVRD